MSDPNQNIKDDIRRAIQDLFADKDRFYKIDVDMVIDIVKGYVFTNIKEGEIRDGNRFEYYYQLLGKSVAVVQGWKINESESIKLPSETKESLVKYIEETYGVVLKS